MPKFSADAFNKAVDHDMMFMMMMFMKRKKRKHLKRKASLTVLNAIERKMLMTTLKTIMLSMMVTTMMTMTILKMTWNQKMGHLRKLFSGSQGSL